MTSRVAVVGPESSGKTTLAIAIADRFGATLVPEVARDYIDALDRPYVEDDLATIARRQREAEDAVAGPRVVCDTTLLIVRVWAQVRFGRVDPWIVEHDEPARYDLHIVTAPDLPWTPDAQRESPSLVERQALFDAVRDAVSDLPHVVVDGADRLESSVGSIDRLDGWTARRSS